MNESSNTALSVAIDALFVGEVGHFTSDEESAIHKQSVADRRRLSADGIEGDQQADLDNHGGAERALHQYPAEHIAYWRRIFDDDAFVPGVFGENISTHGMTEADVHVGDIFSLGQAVIQIAQPRQPCWKPGERLSHKTMARDLVMAGRAGWFFRVLEAGEIAAGDHLRRTEIADHGVTLTRFWEVANDRAPDAQTRDLLAFLIAYDALADEWRPRLKRRLD